jgi:hypothetical protein
MSKRTTNRKAKSGSKVWIKPELTYRAHDQKVKAAIIRNSIEARLLREACTILEANNLLPSELKDWWLRHKE